MKIYEVAWRLSEIEKMVERTLRMQGWCSNEWCVTLRLLKPFFYKLFPSAWITFRVPPARPVKMEIQPFWMSGSLLSTSGLALSTSMHFWHFLAPVACILPIAQFQLSSILIGLPHSFRAPQSWPKQICIQVAWILDRLNPLRVPRFLHQRVSTEIK